MRFSIRDLMFVTVIVALAVGWWVDRQRMREEVPTGYDGAALDGFAKRARQWTKDGREAYVFMINGAKVRAPSAALALQERLR